MASVRSEAASERWWLRNCRYVLTSGSLVTSNGPLGVAIDVEADADVDSDDEQEPEADEGPEPGVDVDASGPAVAAATNASGS